MSNYVIKVLLFRSLKPDRVSIRAKEFHTNRYKCRRYLHVME